MSLARTSFAALCRRGFAALTVVVLGGILALGVLAPRPALAEDLKEEARRHYAAGTKAFQEERWPDAIREFEAAYIAVPDPVFMFNLAQSYRRAGERDKAIDFYEKYLRFAPKAKNRDLVQQTIDELRKQPAAPPTKPAPPPPPDPGAADRPRNVDPAALDADVIRKDPPRLPDPVRHRLRREASFIARLCLGRDGVVSQVKVLQGIAGADDAIVSTLRTWRYKPQPSPVCFVESIVFQME